MTLRTYYGAVCAGNGNFGIVFPDFMGCISAGDTMEEVIAMGHEALQLHVDGMVEDGDAIPESSVVTLDGVRSDFDDPADPIDGEDWVAIVPIVVNVKSAHDPLMIEIDLELSREIEVFNRNQQQFVVDATRRELARLKQHA